MVPSCVPNPDGTGTYKQTPVQYVPTIMDLLDQAGLRWKIYTGTKMGYLPDLCRMYRMASQASNMVRDTGVLTDAANGNLPSLSFVMPSGANSQHNAIR